MIGACILVPSCASGTFFIWSAFFGTHWIAPAGLFVCTHSKPCRLVRYIMLQAVGAAVHAPSSPLVTVSSALPLPHLFFQPKPCSSRPAAAGSGPTHLDGACAPWALPKV